MADAPWKGPAPYAGEDGSDGKSRSRKKRESTALQKRGEELAALGPGVWKTLPVPEHIVAALGEWRGMKNHEARRRQMQYIGRLLREADEDALNTLLDALDGWNAASREERDAQHRIEAMRDALLNADEETRNRALQEALAAHPGLEEARLRHLREAALADKEKQRPPKHARELFRYLKESLGKS